MAQWAKPRFFAQLTETIKNLGGIDIRTAATRTLFVDYQDFDPARASHLIGMFLLSDVQLDNMQNALNQCLDAIAVDLGYTDRFEQDDFCNMGASNLFSKQLEEAGSDEYFTKLIVALIEFTPETFIGLTNLINNAENRNKPDSKFDIAGLDNDQFIIWFRRYYGTKNKFMGAFVENMHSESHQNILNLLAAVR